MKNKCDDCDRVDRSFQCSCGKRLCSHCYYDMHYEEHDDCCSQHEPLLIGRRP